MSVIKNKIHSVCYQNEILLSGEVARLLGRNGKDSKNNNVLGSYNNSLSGATMLHKMKKFSRWLAVAGGVSFLPLALQAQDFVNTGELKNNGTFIVQRIVTGLPAAVGGTFEYSGSIQNVQAVDYQNLRLSGSQTKSTAPLNFNVNGKLEIAPAVTLSINKGNVVTLGDSLFEKGTLFGSIQKSETLPASSQSGFGNVGSIISTTTVSLGSTTVKRTSGDTITAKNGNMPILRYYDISPTTNKYVNATLVFKFTKNELNGHDPSSLQLWRYQSADSTWRRQGGIVDTTTQTITKSGIVAFSRWTAADTAHLLGRTEYEWSPFAVQESAGNNQLVKAKDTSKTLSARLLDAYNNPLRNEKIIFSILAVPAGAVGQRFTADTVLTDTLGIAKTKIILGNKAGKYFIRARSLNITGIQLQATAAIVSGDANNDFAMDVADVTSIISHINAKIPLNGDKLSYADINQDGTVNFKDIDSIRTNILSGLIGIDSTGVPTPDILEKSQQSAAAAGTVAALDSMVARVNVEMTKVGIRINMVNTKSIVGLQAYIRFKNTISAQRTDVVYGRCQQMDIRLRSENNILRLVAYNLTNTPIDTGSGSLFRLPIILSNTADIESVYVVVSTDSGRSVQPLTTKSVAAPSQYPTTFALYQNYPNPFNGGTKIDYDIPDVEGKLKIAYLFVYDILGRRVKTLASGEHEAKRHTVFWNGTNDDGRTVSSGVYFYQLIGKDFVSSKKMVYIK